MVSDYSPHSGLSMKYQTFNSRRGYLHHRIRFFYVYAAGHCNKLKWELLTSHKKTPTQQQNQTNRKKNKVSNKNIIGISKRLLHLKAQVDKILSEVVWTLCWHYQSSGLVPQSWNTWSPEIIYNWNIDSLGYPNIHVFFSLHPLNEGKIRIKYHCKNLLIKVAGYGLSTR